MERRATRSTSRSRTGSPATGSDQCTSRSTRNRPRSTGPNSGHNFNGSSEVSTSSPLKRRRTAGDQLESQIAVSGSPLKRRKTTTALAEKQSFSSSKQNVAEGSGRTLTRSEKTKANLSHQKQEGERETQENNSSKKRRREEPSLVETNKRRTKSRSSSQGSVSSGGEHNDSHDGRIVSRIPRPKQQKRKNAREESSGELSSDSESRTRGQKGVSSELITPQKEINSVDSELQRDKCKTPTPEKSLATKTPLKEMTKQGDTILLENSHAGKWTPTVGGRKAERVVHAGVVDGKPPINAKLNRSPPADIKSNAQARKDRRKSNRRSSFVHGRISQPYIHKTSKDLCEDIPRDRPEDERLALLHKSVLEYTLGKLEEDMPELDGLQQFGVEVRESGNKCIGNLSESGTLYKSTHKDKYIPNPFNQQLEQLISGYEACRDRWDKESDAWDKLVQERLTKALQAEKELASGEALQLNVADADLSEEDQEFLASGLKFDEVLSGLKTTANRVTLLVDRMSVLMKTLDSFTQTAQTLITEKVQTLHSETFAGMENFDNPRDLIRGLVTASQD